MGELAGANADLAQLVRLALGRGLKDYQTEQDRIAPSRPYIQPLPHRREKAPPPHQTIFFIINELY
ncbi:hypothetical protein IUD24_05390 [Xylella fastidiosa subsp. multiplex]|uniref:hypothetical protein n=1 Tax=Xylella fastidiosa TaxID=2371 RepID=UPI00031499D8|nr:hypothetical protein [Xylella fastidiosa]ERI59248.1 hypothetical protein M233_10595 [Xylella fastidiosa subsp. multiplex Griffin-1]QJP47519.1 hypothetical protein HKJ31_00930 [Xylella fastidiosa subsp. multiplex]QPC01127.1 hypothetical protein IUD24_05390 [Xylella fastidiosa subsp. multiplex]UIT46594.1 hypothetical protein LZ751_05390 [Xylella fastidiosa subsp. multiplex]